MTLHCRACKLDVGLAESEVYFASDGKALTAPRHNTSDYLESTYSCPRCQDYLWR